ncbi:hypothetical protein [Sphingobacterium siyangense]|uniref:hypothetical protein n=1 Tax=Sphingobacterium siyangense TaxID=459529 RepID=UPI003C74909F
MNFNKYFIILGFLLCCFASCKKYNSDYTDISLDEEIQFQGSTLDFLEKGYPDKGIKFDSMLMVINGIPGLRDSLSNVSYHKTVFAVPNSCFESGFQRLNSFRQAKNKGRKLSIKDFLIEPFVVIEEKEGPTSDSIIIVKHPYDYRLKLDSIVSKYIFAGNLNTKLIGGYIGGFNTNNFKYEYQMNLLYDRKSAMGVENMGGRRVVLSDKNKTQLDVSWDRSDAQVIDIKTNTGYVHILSNGHEFGFGKLISNFQNYGNEYIYE